MDLTQNSVDHVNLSISYHVRLHVSFLYIKTSFVLQAKL